MSATPSSFVVPLTHLQRRPGNMWETDTQFVVPEDMGVALARIEPGSLMDADVRLESVLDGVLVSADVDYTVSAECSRCLEPLTWNETTSLVELFLYPETDSRGREIRAQGGAGDADSDSETVSRYVVDDCVDLEEVIRDSVVVDLPLKPLCDPDCPGLCPTCGERLDTGSHDHPVTDPRWAALGALREELPPTTA